MKRPDGGAYRKRRSIDDKGGKRYRLVSPEMRAALYRRFDGGSASVWHPDKPGIVLHDIENFWDGPTEVRWLGDNEFEYTSPYNGDTDRFNTVGYYDRQGNLVPWGQR
jgi:hypothetical protein